MAETVDVALKSLAILCLCSHARFIVVDGLGGIIQQGNKHKTNKNAETQQSKDTDFRGQCVGSRKFQLAFWQQELVQLRHETGIQFHERLVEAVVEHL